MVEFVDGSVLAQLGAPTMELPILYALTHPARIPDAAPPFDPVGFGALTFEHLDVERFPAFRLGMEAARVGETAPAVYNAANEIAVENFLAGNLPFGGIAGAIEAALTKHSPGRLDSLAAVLEADRQGRAVALEAIRRQC
jgi:1-deoxy-D-xylulose-5-phosphate reductoisomerase